MEEVVGGAVQTRYTFGTSLVSQTRNVPSAPATSYYGYDAHGNITFLTDAAGTVTDSYDYDAFGNIAAMTGSTTNWRLFGGEEIDPDLGLINLRARQYRPTTGRFLTIDPVVGAPASPISFNRYLYASADPVNLTDPLGLATAAEWGNLVSGVSGSLIRQVVFTAGKGAVIGGSAAVLGHAVACTMLNETSVFTALVSTEDEQEPLLRLSSVLGCGRYTCYCRCHIEGRDRYPGTGIPPMVTGKGRGVDVAAAKVNCEKAAKRNFGDAPWNPGDSRVYTRHCQVSHFQCYKDG